MKKFRMFTFVHVKTPDEEFDAITGHRTGGFIDQDGNYSGDQYSLFELKNGKVKDCCSWFLEQQLTLLKKQNRKLAEQLVDDYEEERWQ